MFEFETITGFLRELTLVDEYSLTILMVMVGWSVLLIHLAVESRLYAAIFVPGMFLGGLIAFRLARLTGFQVVAYKDANAIIVSLLGIVPGFVATILGIRLCQWIGDLRRPVTLENRT
jgi:hypothetical protein